MKLREKTMSERTERGYYRSKQDHEELYWQIMEEYSRFITRPMLLQLNHTWSTQKNEAMNTSVASAAPKTKHYCATNSLLTRVGIAGASQVIGHAKFWSMVCDEFDFKMDANLLSILTQRDEHKRRKNIRQGTLEGKRKRSTKKHEKINAEHKSYMDNYKDGCAYQTGIAVAAAKKSLPKAGEWNPEGTPKELYKCPYYHPLYCTALGHTSCANKDCGMKVKTKAERDAALKVILAEAVNVEVDRSAAISEFPSKIKNTIIFLLLIFIYLNS